MHRNYYIYVQEQLTEDDPDQNRPRAEAALTRTQNRIKVASNS